MSSIPCELCPGTETIHSETCPFLELLADLYEGRTVADASSGRAAFPEIPLLSNRAVSNRAVELPDTLDERN